MKNSTTHDKDKNENSTKGEEALFEVIGNFGPWQRDIFIVFFILNAIGMWQNLAISFLAPNVEYWCASFDDPNGRFLNASLSSPSSSSSSSFVSNSSYIQTNPSENQCEISVALRPEQNDSTSILTCRKWEYNTSFYSQTIVSEWDLVCKRDWLVSFAKSIYMIGFMASVLVFGQFADCFGRFPTILICWVITCSSGILSAFSSSYLMFVVLRFFMAFGRTGFSTTGLVIVMEVVGPKWRTELGIIIQLGCCFGFVTLPAVAWYVRNWFHLQLTLAVPTLFLVCIYWLVPESPRWLMTQRKRKQFESVILKAVKKNRLTLKDDIENILPFPKVKKTADESRRMTFIDLVRTAQMRKRTFNMGILWMVNAFVYYSLAYNTNDLGGNPYLNFFLAGVIEIPAYALSFFTIRKWGRKIPTLVGMMIAGVACAAIIPVPSDMLWLSITFSMIGKFCITGTFSILYLYTLEMFPTVIRTLSIGACSTCARVGSIVAPFVRELGKAHSWAPNAANSSLAISAGLLLLFLPETKDREIPDTLQETEHSSQDSPVNNTCNSDLQKEQTTEI